MNTPETREGKRPNREGILALFEEDLDGSRHSKVFVDVLGECGPYHKEIGELSQAEIRTLEPGLRICVVNRLFERYLAEQGHLDILVATHPYTKDLRGLAPAIPHSAVRSAKEPATANLRPPDTTGNAIRCNTGQARE